MLTDDNFWFLSVWLHVACDAPVFLIHVMVVHLFTNWYRLLILAHTYIFYNRLSCIGEYCITVKYQIIGIFESPIYDVNQQPNTLGSGPLVGRNCRNLHSVMHVLAVIFGKTCHFFFICQTIYCQVEKYVLFWCIRLYSLVLLVSHSLIKRLQIKSNVTYPWLFPMVYIVIDYFRNSLG